mmetsp:Transcript_21994/g.46272  ORF Transcript_21994/g.46272 Transcript_21994/m.46272 type:complete len:524 (-) Transcript_21994:291-1862(-)|eukprot:CAMPEP_0171329152 /NCGR_PEP_ID=MMETSP0878-20121228/1075_1 /TAXON_ID=67004 /ORGANISM="Thalassiosira weissflogii, Strain CCMP1336" /LENGTH=523 /DNA_ID=CAMNT_0011829075 /DNA_START=133 /DNA_END=1704 /DNA_ORIENTATION=-
MMSRRSRARESSAESRQPEDEGRRAAATAATASTAAVPPRTPRTSSSAPTTPKSAPQFQKIRCYRLNLEKPFDISAEKSPSSYLNQRDYTGSINEADMPPSQGPQEYYPPIHLCPREFLRRHSWGGGNNSGSSASDLMANLQVSTSEDSNANGSVNETSIAISTARIFRGITVDRNGVIISQNARATRSKKGNESKNKQGEKSRQAAKIDKAKDLIDDIVDGGGGGGSDQENDPTKIVSLYIMGEYEDLNDLVRDGSRKLRDGKSLSDETLFSYNRSRPIPPHILSPSSSGNANNKFSNGSNAMEISSPSNRKRGSAAHASPSHHSTSQQRSSSRSRYKQIPRSAPPKLKGHPRDRPSTRRMASPRVTSDANSNKGSIGNQRSDSWGGGSTTAANCARPASSSKQHPHHYFREQCNFFPGNSDWTEALGFSVNSLWNCGANNGHLSPMSNPSSPKSYSGASGYGGGQHGGGASYAGNRGYSGGYQQYGQRGYNEDRNPSSGYGYGDDGYSRSRNNGVRDTAVM